VLHGTRDVTWRGLRACNWYLVGASDFKILGGVWGPCRTDGSPSAACGNNKIDFHPQQPTQRVLIDGAVFHDYRVVPGSGAHFECLFIVGSWDVTVRRSKFRSCAYFDIFIQYYQDLNFLPPNRTPFNGLYIENNFFGPAVNEDGISLRNTAVTFSHLDDAHAYVFSDVLVRNNSFYKSTVSFNEGRDDYEAFRYRNVRLYANILDRSSQPCPPIAQGYNVYIRGVRRDQCARTDRVVASYPYVSPEDGDFHIKGGPAVDDVPSDAGRKRRDLAPRVDIDGDLRPSGIARDAGADECMPRAMRHVCRVR